MATAPSDREVHEQFDRAREAYAAFGVDPEAAVQRALEVPISLHSWQGDDVVGFEALEGAEAGGGIMATGGYPGRARTGDELRRDLEQVLSLTPGVHRANLQAFHAEDLEPGIDRDAYEPKHFARWTDWAKERTLGLDFNPTFFSHAKANDNLTLAHPDAGIRDFWVRHAVASRRIAEVMARETGRPCVCNHWVPDGSKDLPADRWSPRRRLIEALDEVLDRGHGVDESLCIDALEGKLFGLGVEAYTVGSHEFYWHYCLKRGLVPCLDTGHFHPTETIVDKLSALLLFHERVLLHVSRPIRWDSDHVTLFDDDVRGIFLELARGGALDRAFVALDFFDASINRVGAYVIGARGVRKAILYGLLDPSERLKELELAGRGAERLALMEEMKTMPVGAVWNELCVRAGVPPAADWVPEIEAYENEVLSKRT